jgi:hypothetical protein
MKVFIILAVSLLLFLSSCDLETPYLFVNVQERYTNDDITVPYEFRSESTQQKCLITVSKKDVFEDEVVYDEEEWLDEEGELYFNLNNGFYTLRFAVMSYRGGEYTVLPFLDEEYKFSVSYDDEN